MRRKAWVPGWLDEPGAQALHGVAALPLCRPSVQFMPRDMFASWSCRPAAHSPQAVAPSPEYVPRPRVIKGRGGVREYNARLTH